MNSKATMQPLSNDVARRSERTVRGWWIVMLAVLGLLSACATTETPQESSPSALDSSSSPAELDEPTPHDSTLTPDTGGDMSIAERTVYFGFDEHSLNAQAQANLDAVAQYMKDNSGVQVKLEGHCDERGSTEYNLALGQRRAQAAKDYLMQLDIDGNRLPTISYGEENPAVEGNNEAAWSQNRRVEFILQNE